MTSRYWVFTKYGEFPDWNPGKLDWLYYQLEQCPETQRYHWQGCCYSSKPVRLTGIKKALGDPTCHVEILKDLPAAIEYCSKTESRIDGPWEFGTRPKGQGFRSDINSLATLVKEGKSDKEIAQAAPDGFMRYYKGIGALRFALQEVRTWKTEVTVLYGPTGCGKSHTANMMTEHPFWMTNTRGWWDGYDGHKDVIIEEFNPEQWNVQMVLKLMDKYPLMVESKGKSGQFLARRLIICTNYHPQDWYRGFNEHVMRRIDHFESFERSYKEMDEGMMDFLSQFA